MDTTETFFCGFWKKCRELLQPQLLPLVVISLIMTYLPGSIVLKLTNMDEDDDSLKNLQTINNLEPLQILIGTHYLLCQTFKKKMYVIKKNLEAPLKILDNVHLMSTSFIPYHYKPGFNIFMDTKKKIFCSGNVKEIFPKQNKNIDIHQPFLLKFITLFFEKIQLIQIEIGSDNIFFVSKKGSVYCLGINKCFQCGIGSNTKQISQPIKVPLTQKILKVAAGVLHTLFLCSKDSSITGSLLVCGYNVHGILGIGRMSFKWISIPLAIPFFRLQIEAYEKILVPPHVIIDICCGGFHSFIINEYHYGFIFGSNDQGQCGVGYEKGDILTPIKINNICIDKVSLSQNHTILLSKQNNLYTFGLNENEQCSRWFHDIRVGWINHLSRDELKLSKNYVFLNVIAGYCYNSGFSLIIIKDLGLFRNISSNSKKRKFVCDENTKTKTNSRLFNF